MSADTVHVKFKVTFPVILITVISLHLIFLSSKVLPKLDLAFFKDGATTLNIRRVKTAEVERKISKTHTFKSLTSVLNENIPKNSITSFKDLAIIPRPGSRPETQRAVRKLSLKSKDFKEFAKSAFSNVADISQLRNVSDAAVSIEVPDGVEPGELNKYELMYYSFEKRSAIGWSNSIMKNFNEFLKKNPRYFQSLDPHSKFTMSARLTYDEKGNVKRIKMTQWTHENQLQELFEKIVKEIDQLHNPPRALWDETGEFSMNFSLIVTING